MPAIDWGSFFGAFGGVAAALAVAAWLGKKLIEHWLAKSSEEHRVRLMAEFDSEKQKALVALENEAHALRDRTARLHEKRLQVMENIYSKLVDTLDAAEAFLHPWQPVGGPSKDELLQRVIDAYDDLSRLFRRNRIYFSQETCDRIETAINAIQVPARKFSIIMKYGDDGAKQAERKYEKWQDLWEQFAKDGPAAVQAVTQEFRELLGA